MTQYNLRTASNEEIDDLVLFLFNINRERLILLKELIKRVKNDT